MAKTENEGGMDTDEKENFGLPQKLFPVATERFFNSENCGQQNIYVTSLNFLNGSYVKVCQLRQLLLRDVCKNANTADIATKDF
jgi:hypothetical protein